MEDRPSTTDFSGGRSPSIWSGSVSILKQYVSNAQDKTGDKPHRVKYGQNYVFAGLMTTSELMHFYMLYYSLYISMLCDFCCYIIRLH